MRAMDRRVGADVGGTFTDVAIWQDGQLRISKVPTTDPQSIGVLEALAETDTSGDRKHVLFHATTVATNAVLERRGGPTGLIVTKGFADILEIQSGRRAELYNLHWIRPQPIVPRELVVEVDERVSADGRIVTGLREIAIGEAVECLVAANVMSIGVCLLFAYLNPRHEEMIRDWVSAAYPDVSVSLSSDVAPEWREYERACTVALNSYLVPVMSSYLADLNTGLHGKGYAREYFVMQSTGGVLPSTRARELPFTTVMSGPAAGVQAAAFLAREAGYRDVLSLDMGGTSTDICLVRNGYPLTTGCSELAGIPIKARTIAVRAIGSGGGSVAHLDKGGALRVGPESAGSRPGPACYAQGGTATTVCDAALVVGYLDPTTPLGGRMKLDRTLAIKAVEKLASKLELTVVEMARSILRLAVDNIAHACRAASLEAGRDPRALRLLAFGGAGPMFACQIAEGVGMREVIIPREPGVTSALGLLVSPLRCDFSRTTLRLLSKMTQQDYDCFYGDLEKRAKDVLEKQRLGRNDVIWQRSVEARYSGQHHEVEISFDQFTHGNPDAIADAFHRSHHDLYGFALEDDIELVTFRLAVEAPPPDFPRTLVGTGDRRTVGSSRHRSVRWPDGILATPVFERSTLSSGSSVYGPAILTQADTTVVLPPGWRLLVDDNANLVMSWSETEDSA
jgi:N-methylhydantoinase A